MTDKPIRVAAALLGALTIGALWWPHATARARGPVGAGGAGPAALAVGTGPFSVAVDSAIDRAFVLNSGDTVSVVDVARGAVVRTVPVPGTVVADYTPGPQLMAVDAATGRVFVANTYKNTLTILDAASGAVRGRTALAGGPLMVAADPSSGHVVAVSGGDQPGAATLSILDGSSGRVLHALPLPDGYTATGVSPDIGDASAPSPAELAVDGRLARVFIVTPSPTDHYGTDLGHGSIGTVDSGSGTVLRTAPIATFPNHLAVDDASGHVFVASDSPTDTTNPPPGDVATLDARTGARLAVQSVGSTTSALAVDPLTERLFVLDPSGLVHVLDARNGREVRAVAVGNDPIALAIDVGAGRVFVADKGDDTVSVLDAHSGAVARTVAVGGAPDALAVDQRRGRVIVANYDGNTVSILSAEPVPGRRARSGGVKRRSMTMRGQRHHPIHLPGLLAACALIALAPAPVSAHAPATGARDARAVPVSTQGRPVVPQATPDLFGVACPGARACYAVGYYGVHDHATIYKTTDGGRSWHAQAPGTSWGLRGVSCPSATTCYAVGYAETTVRTADGGRTWRSTRPLGYQDLGGVACPTAHACLAVGVRDAAGRLFHRIVRITGDGRAWSYPPTPIDGTLYPLAGIACPTALVCYAVGSGATILATRDGGRTWRQQHNPELDGGGIPSPLIGVACASAAACVVVGGFPDRAVILTTGDGGQTWASRASPVRSALSGVACPSAGVCDAVGSGGTVLETRDGGQTWAAGDSGTSAGLNSVACASPSFCVVVGYAGFVAVVRSTAAPNRTPPRETPTPGQGAQGQPTPGPGSQGRPTSVPTAAGQGCATWDISGAWTFTASPGSTIGSGSGQATFAQSGNSLSGTLALAGATYAIKGTIAGGAVTLTLSAPGLADTTLSGAVSADGGSIDVGQGTFQGKATCA